jgi:serine/threonine protein kinase
VQGEGRRYRIIEAIGRGGFGTVYKAALLGPGGFKKTVALKVLNPEIAEREDLAARLRDEARMLGLLRHRAVVHVDGLQRLGDRWAVVMEYVEGVDLKGLLAGVGRLPVGVALEIVEEVASALENAFATLGEDGTPLRLLHRDVKPSNIRLTPAGEVKVLDFGVARADFSNRESQTRSIFFGSLMYMAPERLDGIDTHRGDVYACGALLFELLTGEALGRTSGNRERHEARVSDAMDKLWAAVPDEAVFQTVGACLDYDESARPGAKGLARHLRTLRSSRPGPFLRDWAEKAVLSLPHVPCGAEKDDLSGSILVEEGVALSGTLPAPRTPVRSGLKWALASGSATFGFIVVCGAVGIGMVLVQQSAALDAMEIPGGSVEVVGGQAETAGPDDARVRGDEAGAANILAEPSGPARGTDRAQADAGKKQASATGASSSKAAASGTSAAPTTAATTKSNPKAKAQPAADEDYGDDREPPPDAEETAPAVTTAAAPASAAPASAAPATPATAAPANARVLLGGGAKKVRLIGASGEFGPGAVPAGAYAVDADFGDGTWRRAGNIRVREDQVGRLVCRENLGRCTLR